MRWQSFGARHPLGVATIPDAAGASNDAVEECSVDLTAEETQQLQKLSQRAAGDAEHDRSGAVRSRWPFIRAAG